MPACTGQTKGGPAPLKASSGTCLDTLLPFEITPEPAGVSPAVVRVTRFSFLFMAGVVALQVRWGNKKTSVHLHSRFTLTDFAACMSSVGSERGKTQGCLQNSLTYLSKSSSSKWRGIITDSSHQHINLECVWNTEDGS